ncbi:glycosyltransferase family 2 protein [Hyunsoonleella flava]|uniref:Glycosyltransferase family 2 protein n=1 Tax=Hyunsoonleella flava TaxID=2527939 RepID=A0A4Q9FKY4_9FLAO|nr:glycosyltransferase family A protein [Hyunsoonleella flava]TBN05625.1 glycosyltransferase family 2 protein [Hyunsoonleella flava]
MPFFSVVIPLYNKEEQIENTLKNVLNQSFSDFEVIIVNDGSTDKSLQTAASVSDSRIQIYSQKNAGASSARNLGITKSSSKYIALLDADDTWYPNHLEEHHKSIIRFTDGDLFCNAYALKLSASHIENATYNIETKNEPHIITDYFKASTIHPIGWTSALVIKKSAFDAIGGFNDTIISGQDLDLLIRFGLKKTVVFNPTITCYYDKTVQNSLSKENHQEGKYLLFNSFTDEELNNKSLHLYLTLNRYSLAIQCKRAKNKKTFKKLLPEIDTSLLNWKQRLLLQTPSSLVILLKKIHLFLISKGFYVSSYK